MPQYQNVAIVGVGLMGGSIGLAVRERGLAAEIVGVGRRQSSLDKALDCGAITRATTDFETGIAEAELVVVCTSVETVADFACRALRASGATVTDIGSTKAEICRQIEDREGMEAKAGRFVGSHPLAGDHRTGPENAWADLLTGKNVVMTPTAGTATETVEQVQDFWQALGMKVVQMSPAEHDQALASTSHLPHLVASALAAATPEEWLPLAATGWGDSTRVAAGDPTLWTQIFAQNSSELLMALGRMSKELDQLQNFLAEEDWNQIQEYLTEAKRIRDALGN